jgi:hypothetical protein
MQKISCIYKISFSGTDKVYIGQTTDYNIRCSSHLTCMKAGKSPKRLQAAYDEYGVPQFSIIIECDAEELDSLEEEAIQVYDAIDNGFNTFSKFGHRTLLKGEKTGNSKYSNDQIEEVFGLLVNTDLHHREITEITGISRGTIADISGGIGHTWLAEKYPQEYKILLDKKLVRRVNSICRTLGAAGKNITYPKVLSPEGVVYTVTALRQFCREHNLNHGSLGTILRQGWGQHKGWKVIT